MALTDALYAPIASFEQAQPRAFERALSPPPEEFDTTGDSTANLILCSRQGSDATHEALDRTSVVEVRRGAWPDMFEPGASERQSGTKLRTKGGGGSGFSKPPAAAFDACFRVGGDDKSSVQARTPADIEQVTLEAKEPKKAGKAGSSDSDAADLGWIGDIFEDM